LKTNKAIIVFISALLSLVAGQAEARHSGGVRTQAIDMIVIHSTGGPTCDATTGKPVWVGAGALEENLRQIEADPILGIHYMIDRDGTVRSSIPEDQIAHHVFHYSGRSIAIELINEGDGRDPFPEAQLASLVKLLNDIVQRRRIRRDGIKRHSDLDHGRMSCDKTRRRKVDPGDAYPHEWVIDRVFKSDRKAVAPSHAHS
jgi:N-acetylmuramoyl-L-alanine amidase